MACAVLWVGGGWGEVRRVAKIFRAFCVELVFWFFEMEAEMARGVPEPSVRPLSCLGLHFGWMIGWFYALPG